MSLLSLRASRSQRPMMGVLVNLTAFLAIWCGAIWLMLAFAVPMLFPIVFGLFAVLLVWVLVELWFYRSVVEASPRGLVCRGRLLGIGRRRVFAPDEIEEFEAKQSMSTGTQVWTKLTVVPHDGRQRTLAKSICSRAVERAVLDELNAALGRAHRDD